MRGNPKPSFQFFATEVEREKAARSLAEKKTEHGRAILKFTPDGWAEYLTAKELVGGEDLRRVAREWVSGSGADGAVTTSSMLTVKEAVQKYLELRYAFDVNRESDTGRHLDLHLARRFVGTFGAMRLSDLKAEDLRGWLKGLKNPDNGEPMSNLTKRHHRKDVNTFFKRAVAEEWIRKNPCELVDLPPIDDDDVSVLPVHDAWKLLHANRAYPIVHKLALEMFGGLRCSSVERIKREHINFADRGITMPGQIHKSGKRKFRQGHPEVLWAWLSCAPDATWEQITEKNYDDEKGKAFIRAGVKNAGNVLRHSFASYLLAQTKSIATVGYLMQHAHQNTTEGYQGVATEADAKIYLSLTPARVAMNWEEVAKTLLALRP